MAAYKPENPVRAQLEERVKSLPLTPGVYIMKDVQGNVIYVGKAVALRNRVRSYFGSLKGQQPKVAMMVSNIADFEYILTDTELEALILENNLIKKHKPKYNIRLKDDKTYPYIKVTTNEEWPRVFQTRKQVSDGALYFGPFAGAGAAWRTLELLDKLFPYRTCDIQIDGKAARPCLQYFIHRCLGPCASLADKGEYDKAISQVTLFLEGKQEQIIKDVRQRMEAAAESLAFESAAYLRDQMLALQRVVEQQKVLSTTPNDEDVIAFAREDGETCVQVFFIRQGKLLGREHFILEGTLDESDKEVMSKFITQFYDEASYIPPKLLLQNDISEAAIIEQWLRQRKGSKVMISVPRRGQKRELVDLVAKNAAETLEQLRVKLLSDERKASTALTELQQALSLPAWPLRMECYDISHTQGTNSVASMVVFENGVPKKSEYRRFKIKTVAGNDDYASMQEVLYRRLKRAATERRKLGLTSTQAQTTAPATASITASVEGAEMVASFSDEQSDNPRIANINETEGIERSEQIEEADRLADSSHELNEEAGGQGQEAEAATISSWAVLPDLIVVDGGKGQLNAAYEVLKQLEMTDLAIVGIAKREEEVFRPGDSTPVILPRDSQALFLVQRLRDEAHRFAITYHRNLRGKAQIASTLDSVKGIGPRRKKELITRFGSVKGVREATDADLLAVPGMNAQIVAALREGLGG